MNILTRFRDIMASNIHALLDKAEDPEKLINQYMRTLSSDLGKVKSETASIMAAEIRAKRELTECTDNMNKMKQYAIKALESNNEADARKFLERKSVLATKERGLKQAYEISASNAKKMRAMHDKLISDMTEMESRLDMLKGKLSAARTQEIMNKMNSSAEFDRLEDKVNLAMDTANAVAELNSSFDDDMTELTKSYDDDTDVDSELEALKRSLREHHR